nr:alpha/beta fold hydrolase [Kibdelosporangium sp. MJ126-NF4]CEL13754.1 putative peptidase [Kibdelosporangium sp. MJ126-NF4]CTQ99440.1 putative peptidase [Kibdelosporangium sp. MJ126-NF4]
MSITGAWPTTGGFAYVSTESGRPQPWLRTGDGPARPLAIDGAVQRLAWRPDGTRLLAQTDLTGAENYQLAEIDPVTGTLDWIDRQDHVRHEIGVPYSSGSQPYSPDGRLLAYASTARDETCFDVYLRDLASGQTRTLLRGTDLYGDDRYLPMCFSPDSQRLLVLRLHQNSEHDLFACDVRTGQVEHLTPHEGPAKYLPGGWAEDGIYLCTTQGRDHLGVARLVPGQPLDWLATPEHDIETVVVGPRVLWPTLTDDGHTLLGAAAIPGIACVAFGSDGFHPRYTPEGRLLVQAGAADRATEIYLADPDTGTVERLTHDSDALPAGLVVPRTVRFPSDDGLEITGLLYRPRGDTPRAGVPAVLHIHGGPEDQARPLYDPLIQDLVRAGIAVLAPNVRGSTGRGLRYQRMVYRDWGGGDLRDLAACAEFLRAQPGIDGTRLGVYGESYGGFATLSCLSRLPELWRAGVAVCAPCDLESNTRAFPPTWRRRAAEWVGDVEDPAERARLAQASPQTHAANIHAPLLLGHGVNDSRVAIKETDTLHATLVELGRTVRLVRMTGGHTVFGPGEWDAFTAETVTWFRTHL